MNNSTTLTLVKSGEATALNVGAEARRIEIKARNTPSEMMSYKEALGQLKDRLLSDAETLQLNCSDDYYANAIKRNLIFYAGILMADFL